MAHNEQTEPCAHDAATIERRESSASCAATTRGMDSGASESSVGRLLDDRATGNLTVTKMVKSAIGMARAWTSKSTRNGGAASPSPPVSPARNALPVPQEATAPPLRVPFQLGKMYELLRGKLSFVVVTGNDMTRRYIQERPDLFFFSLDHQERYEPFCADFGPVNLSAVHGFCVEILEFWKHPSLEGRHLVYYCEEPVNVRTNAAFLLAAFMVCELGATPEEAWQPFGRLSEDAFATFRDATFCEQDYHLTIKACLQGLRKGIECGWYDPSSFCAAEYDYLDDPGNADCHVVSPKFAAFKGPSAASIEIARGVFTFTPNHYTEVFGELGVTAVVRLNEPSTYDPAGFTKAGFRHHDLYFDDCTAPDAAVVDKFLEICEAEEGMVAVHCKAGLGRTGTLIAIYFMKHFGWTASECIGWLRIVRPGSIIGPQQQYLHWAEGVYRKGATNPNGPASFEHSLGVDQSEVLGLQVAAAQTTRAEKRGAGRAGSSGSFKNAQLDRAGSCGSQACAGSSRLTSFDSLDELFRQGEEGIGCQTG